jgi:ABC-type polysaccharide/polyol phosphate transport system ATPase subunit
VSGSTTIESRAVWKSFEKGRGDVLTTRERWNLRRTGRSRTSILEDITFDVRAGEVMGCVGPNGAGKSTLLKLIAGIYNVDRGTIRVAGRVAPLIELGVGFRPDLPAHENILINGVMMGLTPAEARRRTDEIIDFAELRDFTSLKLKNYSSGMRGRLGFAVMINVDADILLIDEILSVGDKSFREKCGDVISQMRRDGQTVMLVSHEMGSIVRHCDRAMLLKDHRIQILDEAEAVANHYHELHAIKRIEQAGGTVEDDYVPPARVAELTFASGDPRIEPGDPIEVEADVEIGAALAEPGARFAIHDPTGRVVYVTPLHPLGAGPIEPGARFRLRATIENRLTPGDYRLSCRVAEAPPADGSEPLSEPLSSPARWLQFTIRGEVDTFSLIELESEIEVEPVDSGVPVP